MRQFAQILRWTARILSLAVFVIVLMFAIGETTAQPGVWPTGSEWVGILFFPVGLVGGLLFGWLNERWGGWLAFVSMVAFYAWNFTATGLFPRGPWLLILTIPAVLYLLVAQYDGYYQEANAALAMER